MMHIFLFTWRLHWRDKTLFLIQLVELIVCRWSHANSKILKLFIWHPYSSSTKRSHDHWFSRWILNGGKLQRVFQVHILRLISLKSLVSQIILMVNRHIVPFQSSECMIIITQLDFMLWLSFHIWVSSTTSWGSYDVDVFPFSARDCIMLVLWGYS